MNLTGVGEEPDMKTELDISVFPPDRPGFLTLRMGREDSASTEQTSCVTDSTLLKVA